MSVEQYSIKVVGEAESVRVQEELFGLGFQRYSGNTTSIVTCSTYQDTWIEPRADQGVMRIGYARTPSYTQLSAQDFLANPKIVLGEDRGPKWVPKVGDRVRYVSGRHGDEINNPVYGGKCGYVEGVIADTRSGSLFPFSVHWDNGQSNQYQSKDMELATPTTPPNEPIIPLGGEVHLERTADDDTISTIPLRDKVYGKQEHEDYMAQAAHQSELAAAAKQFEFGQLKDAVHRFLCGTGVAYGPTGGEED